MSDERDGRMERAPRFLGGENGHPPPRAFPRALSHLQRPALPAVPGVDGDQAVEGRLLAAKALEADLCGRGRVMGERGVRRLLISRW